MSACHRQGTAGGVTSSLKRGSVPAWGPGQTVAPKQPHCLWVCCRPPAGCRCDGRGRVGEGTTSQEATASSQLRKHISNVNLKKKNHVFLGEEKVKKKKTPQNTTILQTGTFLYLLESLTCFTLGGHLLLVSSENGPGYINKGSRVASEFSWSFSHPSTESGACRPGPRSPGGSRRGRFHGGRLRSPGRFAHVLRLSVPCRPVVGTLLKARGNLPHA